MLMPSQTIARLVEPTLHAVSRPSALGIRAILDQALASTRATREVLRQQGETVHALSFELGAGTAFVEMLGTMQQRSILGDAIRAATEAPRGTEILHLVGVLSLSTAAATQGGLADRLGIDRGNFNRYVRRLEDAGLIQSQRSSRRVDYRPLPLGLEVLDYLRPGWKAIDPKTNALLQFEESIQASAAREPTGLAGLGNDRKEVSVLALLEAVTRSNAVFGSEDMRMGRMSSHRSFGISRASTSQTRFFQEVA